MCMCMCMCMRTCAHIDRCMHVRTIFTEHKQDITGLYLFRLIVDINLLHKSGGFWQWRGPCNSLTICVGVSKLWELPKCHGCKSAC